MSYLFSLAGHRHAACPAGLRMARAVAFWVACSLALSAQALEVLPPQHAVPGGVIALPLGPAPLRPQASLAGVPVMVVGDATHWTAVLGLSLGAKPGPGELVVRRPGQAEEHLSFTI